MTSATDALLARLAESKRITEAATRAPWAAVRSIVNRGAFMIPGVAPVLHAAEADAVFMVHARTALPERDAIIAAVLAKCDEWTTEGETLIAEWNRHEDECDVFLLSHGSELVDKAATIRRVIEEAGHA